MSGVVAGGRVRGVMAGGRAWKFPGRMRWARWAIGTSAPLLGGGLARERELAGLVRMVDVDGEARLLSVGPGWEGGGVAGPDDNGLHLD